MADGDGGNRSRPREYLLIHEHGECNGGCEKRRRYLVNDITRLVPEWVNKPVCLTLEIVTSKSEFGHSPQCNRVP